MKHILVLVVFVFASTAMATESFCQWPNNQTLDSIVPIQSGQTSHASGVIISNNLVITAAHVLEDSSDVIAVVNEKYYQAKILFIDQETDIALLSVRTDNLSPIPLSKSELNARQEVWAVGFPRAQAQHTSIGQFNFKQAEAIHTSAGIDVGESGGGLLSCENGKFVLAGMLRGYGAYLTNGELVRLEDYSISVAASNIQIAIDSSEIGL